MVKPCASSALDRNLSNSPRCLRNAALRGRNSDCARVRSEGFPTSAAIVCCEIDREPRGHPFAQGIGGVQKPLLSSPRGGATFPSGSWLAEVDRLGPIDGKTGHSLSLNLEVE